MKTQITELVPGLVREAYLREVIKESGMTHAELAKQANIPASTLATMLKNGIAGSALDSIVRICDILKVDLDSFVRGNVPASSQLHEQKTNIASRIRDTRITLRIRMAAAAKHLQIPLSFYKEIEGGQHFINFEYIEKLSDFFHVSTAYLTCNSDNAPELEYLLYEPDFDAKHEPYNYGLGIRMLRKNLGIDHEDFAKRINISTDLLKDWESNIRVPWGDEIQAIADEFVVPYTTLCIAAFSDDINMLISKYAEASERDQQLVRIILGLDAE